MRYKKKIIVAVLVVLVLTTGLILSGCDNNSALNSDIVYKFAGSIGVGDFITVDINLSNKTYKYRNLINNDSGSGTFSSIGKNFYQMDTGDEFVMLSDQILLVSVKDEVPGQRLITALKKASRPYGSEIAGIYNVATSLEGWVGTVTIMPDTDDPSTGTVTAELDYDGDGTVDETYNNMPYTFNEDYDAIEVKEGTNFRHFGVFINNQVGIFDSYIGNGAGGWDGDGMFVLVRQSLVALSDYAGEYTYIDVDGDSGTFELVDGGTGLELIVDGKDTGEILTDSDFITGMNGVIHKEIDLIGEDGIKESWNFTFLTDKVIIVASADDETFGEGDVFNDDDGGIAVGLKTD